MRTCYLQITYIIQAFKLLDLKSQLLYSRYLECKKRYCHGLQLRSKLFFLRKTSKDYGSYFHFCPRFRTFPEDMRHCLWGDCERPSFEHNFSFQKLSNFCAIKHFRIVYSIFLKYFSTLRTTQFITSHCTLHSWQF